LTLGGADGVAQVMEHFRSELVRAMQLTGTPSLKDATPDLLAPI
jgi:isopentenyl diphosphate isomerase/L-lactate dehydrogenase-like FMN-dependent dehydrogenase